MNILVINCGSSSLKYQLINADNEEVLAKGLCERIGIDGGMHTYQPKGSDKIKTNIEINENLTQQAVALFRHFLPYSVEDQLPDGWKVGTVGDIVEIHDYKR